MAGFKISGKDNTEVLLAGGGSKALSDFAMSTALSGYLPLSGGKMTGNIDFNGYAKNSIDTTNAFASFLPSDGSHRASGVYGVYDSTKLGHVWSIDTAYRISNDGHDPNTLYGLAYFHTNWSNSSTYNTNAANKTAIGTYAGGHLVGWFLNGVISASIGSYIWTRNGYLKNGSSDSYVLLGGGGHKQYSTSSIADTIVSRDSHQYIYAKYYNSAIADENTISIGSVYVRNTSDDWIRRMAFSTFCEKVRDSGSLDNRYVKKSGDAMSGTLSILRSLATDEAKTSPANLLILINAPSTPADGWTTELLASWKIAPGIGFHWPSVSWASIIYNGQFRFINNSYTGYVPISAMAVYATGGNVEANGYLKSTAHGNTIQIGSQNGDWAHITSSKPFWFSTSAFFLGNVCPYTTNTCNLGNSNYAWNNIYANDITLKNITNWDSVALSENKIRLLSRSGSTAPTGAPGSYYSGLSIMTDYVGFLLAVYGGSDNKLYFRLMQDNGTWHGWYVLLNSNNYSSYALPLTGGTLTGNLTIKKSDPRIYFYHSDTYISDIGANTTYGLWILNRYNTSSWESHYINLKDQLYFDNKYPFIHSGNISSYALTSLRIADALGAGGAPITTSVSSTRITDSYYVLATTSSGSCAWYKLPSNAFLNDNTNTTYSPGTGLSLDGTTFNAKLATNALLGVTKYVKYYSAASVKRYNGDVGGSEVDTSTTSNIELAYASSTSGRFYPVLVDKNGFPFVNIPWSDTNTTYTFTTSGSGNVLTGVSTSGTTITFTKGNVSSGSTYGVASTSSSGLAPQLSLDSTNTIASQSTDYVLTYKSGTNTTPVWRKLPTNAFLNDNSWREIYIDGLSISSNSLNLKHGTNISLSRSGGDVTITASTQFLVVSSLPSGSSITSGVLYLVTT